MLLPHLTDRHLCEHTACFISKHSMNILNPPLWTSPPLLAMLLVFSSRIAILAFCSSFSGVNTSPPYKSAADSVSLKPQITNPPTLKALSFQACIFLACEGVSAITLSFRGIVSKPLSVYHEYLPKSEWTSPLLAAPIFCAFLPPLPTILCSLYAPSLHPLYMWCLLSNPHSLLLSPQPAPAIAWQCSHSPEPKYFLPLLRHSTVGLSQISRKLDDPWPKFPIFLFPPHSFPICWISVAWKRKHQLGFFLFTPSKISGITSLPF